MLSPRTSSAEVLPSRLGPDPERPEIAQLHDVAFCNLARDHVQKILDCRRRIRRADGGHLGGHLGQLDLIHFAGRNDGRVELLGRRLICWIAAAQLH